MLPNWIDRPGNQDRKKHIKHAIAHLKGLVRIVILQAIDENTQKREIESAFPMKGCWFKITLFDETTGQVALEFSHKD